MEFNDNVNRVSQENITNKYGDREKFLVPAKGSAILRLFFKIQ